MEKLVSALAAYAKEIGISKKQVAEELGIPYSTLEKWFFKGKTAKKPSNLNRRKIQDFLQSREEFLGEVREARRRAQKIKYLLLLIEDELRWFRHGNSTGRDVFRKEIDSSDLGYVSSLLTMLSDEDRFKRWRALTTTRFHSFRRR